MTLTANVGNGCGSGNISTSCSGSCPSLCNGSSTTITQTCVTKSKIISNYECGRSYPTITCYGNRACWRYSKDYGDGGSCGIACPNHCSGKINWQCLQSTTEYKTYAEQSWGRYCWCLS